MQMKLAQMQYIQRSLNSLSRTIGIKDKNFVYIPLLKIDGKLVTAEFIKEKYETPVAIQEINKPIIDVFNDENLGVVQSYKDFHHYHEQHENFDINLYNDAPHFYLYLINKSKSHKDIQSINSPIYNIDFLETKTHLDWLYFDLESTFDFIGLVEITKNASEN